VARPKKRRHPLKVPYHRALQACAYADLPYVRAIKLLKSYGFLIPLIDEELRAQYKVHRKEAKEIDEDFDISPRMINALKLEPMYSWIKAVGNPHSNPRSSHMTRILDEMTHPILRRSIDVLLFVGRSYTDIIDVLQRQCDSPVPEWSVEDLEVYDRFFWDTKVMTLHDWMAYATWCMEDEEDYAWNYVFLFPTASIADLLWEAGITPDFSQSQISDLMLHECFVRFKNKLESNDESGALRFMNAYRQLLDVVKKGAGQSTSSTTKRRADRLGEALDRVEILFKDDRSPEPETRERLQEGGRRIEVSSKDAVDINPAAIDVQPSNDMND